jgi:acyl-CoA-binding protein
MRLHIPFFITLAVGASGSSLSDQSPRGEVTNNAASESVPSDLEREFALALNFVKNMPQDGTITDAERLAFYANYKIANDGPCNIPKPGILNFQAAIKWQAWTGLGNKSASAAMADYLALLDEKVPSWRTLTP